MGSRNQRAARTLCCINSDLILGRPALAADAMVSVAIYESSRLSGSVSGTGGGANRRPCHGAIGRSYQASPLRSDRSASRTSRFSAAVPLPDRVLWTALQNSEDT